MSIQTTPEIDDDLTIKRITRQAAGSGTWVIGRLDGYRFDALVFPAHAIDTDWELGDSQISKLWVQRVSDKTNVYNWDRGADIEPADEEVQQVVDFLAGGLADVIFGAYWDWAFGAGGWQPGSAGGSMGSPMLRRGRGSGPIVGLVGFGAQVANRANVGDLVVGKRKTVQGGLAPRQLRIGPSLRVPQFPLESSISRLRFLRLHGTCVMAPDTSAFSTMETRR